MMERKNHIEILKKKLEELKCKSDKLEKMELKGFIGNRFRRYCEHLLMLDHAAEEMRIYSSLLDKQMTINSGLEMRQMLDSLAGLYIHESIVNPKRGEFYQELFLLGKSKYDEAVERIPKTLLELN